MIRKSFNNQHFFISICLVLGKVLIFNRNWPVQYGIPNTMLSDSYVLHLSISIENVGSWSLNKATMVSFIPKLSLKSYFENNFSCPCSLPHIQLRGCCISIRFWLRGRCLESGLVVSLWVVNKHYKFFLRHSLWQVTSPVGVSASKKCLSFLWC